MRRYHDGEWLRALALISACGLACSSGTTDPTRPQVTGPTAPAAEPPGDPGDLAAPGPEQAPTTRPSEPPSPALGEPNRPPQLFLPPHRAVGRGQTVSFGLAAIDPELDVVRVELLEKPESASYDPYTLTVTWTPTRADGPAGQFTARVTETRIDDGETRSYLHAFSIDVTRRRQPVPEARPLSPAVEILLTVHDDDRLAAVNRKLPFPRTLALAAERFAAALPEDARDELEGPPDGKTLYHTFLAALAELHDNPRLDPEADEFDRRAFGDPRDWTIVAVRPRLDKSWQEVRIVYEATAAPEPVFAMFRFRPVSGDAPAAARSWNNRVFSESVFEAFFDEKGHLDPRLVDDRRAHARALARWLEGVLEYRDEDEPWARATFLALATGARMGGGSVRGDDGDYQSGDGWAWSAMKPLPTSDGTALAYVNIPIKGFWTDSAPAEDGEAWKPVCAPRFDPDDPAHEPGYEVLCRKNAGLVDLPAVEGDTVVSGHVDAQNLYVDHKRQHFVERLPLRDPRRDLGEEKGMTCSQCHTRTFGVRDYYRDLDPDDRPPEAKNPRLPTTNFQIVPTTSWQAYTIEFQKHQQCRARKAFAEYLGKDTALDCPLKP